MRIIQLADRRPDDGRHSGKPRCRVHSFVPIRNFRLGLFALEALHERTAVVT